MEKIGIYKEFFIKFCKSTAYFMADIIFKIFFLIEMSKGKLNNFGFHDMENDSDRFESQENRD